jgi:hypothetical protein
MIIPEGEEETGGTCFSIDMFSLTGNMFYRSAIPDGISANDETLPIRAFIAIESMRKTSTNLRRRFMI